jgi:glycosyltransferase involved in cell wall biosynthesis
MRVAHIATVDASLRYLLLNQLVAIRQAGYEVVGISAGGPHVSALEAAGIRHIAAPLTRRFAPAADFRALAALVKILRRERFDIVHTHTPKGGLLGQYAALFARTPIRVHTIHGLYFPGHMKPEHRWRYAFLERTIMRPSHLNLSQSVEDVETARREKLCRGDRVELLATGIDVEHFTPDESGELRRRTRATLGFSDDDLVIGMVARLVREKGYVEMLHAAKTIAEREPRARFLFIGGDDSVKSDALDAATLAAAGLEDRLRLLGHRDDMRALYAAMDVFALPSHREGLPRAPMEAASMCLPAVVTDVRGCRQTVEDGKTGLIVPVRDAQALAGALLELLGDPRARSCYGANARRKALAEFDERVAFQHVIDAYERLQRH